MCYPAQAASDTLSHQLLTVPRQTRYTNHFKHIPLVYHDLSLFPLSLSLSPSLSLSLTHSLTHSLSLSLSLSLSESSHQVEAQWVLALAIKALGVVLSSWQHYQDGPIIEKLLKRSLLASIVKISGQPTQFSRSWLLGDLEVCSSVNKRSNFMTQHFLCLINRIRNKSFVC